MTPCCLGIDAGSSFIKAALYDAGSGSVAARASWPDREMPVDVPAPGHAEQDPELWWEGVRQLCVQLQARAGGAMQAVQAIGIAYQMHGLVLVDREIRPVRPAIIWCDSRAAEIGRQAGKDLGAVLCNTRLLNSPGNFTASKLFWVKQNEPAVFARAYRLLLPGDFLAARLTGRMATTPGGLSEAVLWDFPGHRPADTVLDYFGIPAGLLPELVPVLGVQGRVTPAAARELGLPAGIPVTYRAGDQPNNAFALNVLQPGEIAATAGTSGVVFAVGGRMRGDPEFRVNAFAHVNHSRNRPRIGTLLCINGAASANAWARRLAGEDLTYDDLNRMAAGVPPGAKGLIALPFGNGAERMFGDRDTGARLLGINFHLHGRPELVRAIQEGVAFSFAYGLEILNGLGIRPRVLRAGQANLFLSPVFRKTLATVSDLQIELYDTDGAQGAACAAAAGAGLIASPEQAAARLHCLEREQPAAGRDPFLDAYRSWRERLLQTLREEKECQP